MGDTHITRYFYKTEIVEMTGTAINLLSIGIVSEDGRTYYSQNPDIDFREEGDDVFRNIYPHLTHFHLRGERACNEIRGDGGFTGTGVCSKADCAWRHRSAIAKEILAFTDASRYGMPEFWSLDAAHDHVVLCQLFGRRSDWPGGWIGTMDVQQWATQSGNLFNSFSLSGSSLSKAQAIQTLYSAIHSGKRRRKRVMEEVSASSPAS